MNNLFWILMLWVLIAAQAYAGVLMLRYDFGAVTLFLLVLYVVATIWIKATKGLQSDPGNILTLRFIAPRLILTVVALIMIVKGMMLSPQLLSGGELQVVGIGLAVGIFATILTEIGELYKLSKPLPVEEPEAVEPADDEFEAA